MTSHAACRNLPSAVLWDLDGTLIDSDKLWLEAERDLYRNITGDELPVESERALEGASLPACARILRTSGVDMPPDVIIDHLVDDVERGLTAGQDDIPWAQGAVSLLESLRAIGVPSVLVTGTPMRIVQHVLDYAPDGAFIGSITADSPLPAKPAPDRYCEAARMTGANIRECLVFEDSSVGIQAGLSAGARVVAVTAMSRSPVPPSPHYRCIADFRGLDAKSLSSFMRGQRFNEQ